MSVQCRDVQGIPRTSVLTLEIQPFVSGAMIRYEETERELIEKQTEHLGNIAKAIAKLAAERGKS